MKKIFLPFLFSAILLIGNTAFGQNSTITMGIRGNACDQLVVEWNSSYAFTNAPYNAWTQATLTITWPQALGASVLGTITSYLPGFTGWQYNGSAVLNGSVYQREVILLSGAYNQNIPVGVTEIIAITLSGTGTGDFTIADPFGNTNISNGYYGTGIWTGSFSPATATGVYLDDRIAWDGTKWCGGSGTNYQPGAGDTKPCYIMGLNGHLTVWGAQVGSLTVETTGQLTIDPGASLTNSGATVINSASGLIMGANANGTGSFIPANLTTITYGASGSASVQAYIKNVEVPDSLHYHLIGPMVKDPAYSAGGTGVYLNSFNLLVGGTYAYRYNEPTNAWINIFNNTDPVPTTAGITMSDISGTSKVLTMTGQLVQPQVNDPTIAPWDPTITAGEGNGVYLFSNPFPSAIDLTLFYTDNSLATRLGGNFYFWVWDDQTSTYGIWDADFPIGTGNMEFTNGMINPGQGFFAQLAGTGAQVRFRHQIRGHYYGPFLKSDPTNVLRVSASGNYSKDDLIVRFRDEASSGYDPKDADKWFSMKPAATELWTQTDDNQPVTINSMPTLLEGEMVNVPLSFKCGTDDAYTIEARSIESFVSGTEIWLEDLMLGGEWHNLVQNPVYAFSGSSEDPQNRFVLHFFGPTGIADPDITEPIQIYSWHHDAYIVNRGNETIEEYMVYDMMGRELQHGSLPNSTVNKVFVGEISNYYIVKVVTNGRTYSEKVFISR